MSDDSCVIEEEIWLAAAPGRVFRALTEGAELERWWPKHAESEVRVGGRLVFEWFDLGRLETRFDKLVEGKEVAFDFAGEKVRFELSEDRGGTQVKITHPCAKIDRLHVAAAWGFLKGSLKGYVEFGVDLRGNQG